MKDLLWFYVIEDAPLATVQHGQRRMITALHSWYMALTAREEDWRHFPRSIVNGYARQSEALVVTPQC